MTEKNPAEMNITEWCEREADSRLAFLRAKQEVNRAGRRFRRENRVQHLENILHELEGLDVRTLAERIDQSYYPEAWGMHPHRKDT